MANYNFVALNYCTQTDTETGVPLALAYAHSGRPKLSGRASLNMALGWRTFVSTDHQLFLEFTFQEWAKMPAQAAMEEIMSLFSRPGEVLQLAFSGCVDYDNLPIPQRTGWFPINRSELNGFKVQSELIVPTEARPCSIAACRIRAEQGQRFLQSEAESARVNPY